MTPGKNKVLSVLRRYQLAVIATASATRPTPESALIAFTEDDDLCLYFQTGRNTRKASNLLVNPHVSLVIGHSFDDLITLQYEGTAIRLTTAEEFEECRQRFVEKDSPTNEDYFNHPTAIFFKVLPTWIGCSDYSGELPEVIELTDF